MDEPTNMMPVEVRFKPDGKWWIATAPELEISTQGETFEAAQANLKEALFLFFESCLRRGILEEVLRQAGFTALRVKAVRRAVEPFIPPQTPTTACHA